MNKNIFKIVLLGDGRVGKTSILNMYINNTFDQTEEMTVNPGYFQKEFGYNGDKYIFCIWDTAGQEKFNALTPIYYRDAKGAILVYDVTLPETLTRVKKWIEELKTFNKNTILAVAGNKSDLNIIEVDKDTVMDYCTNENAPHFFTSAKTGEGLNEIFSHVFREIIISAKEKDTSKEIASNGRQSKSLSVSKHGGNTITKSDGCCE